MYLLEPITQFDNFNIIKFYDKNISYFKKFDNLPSYKDENFFSLIYEMINKKKMLVYCLKYNNIIIGMYYIEEINRTFYKSGSLSYCIDEEYASQGITTSILKANLDRFLADANINRVKCTIDIDNLASIALLTKLNFKIVGPIPSYFKINNQMTDCYIAFSNTN